MIQEIEESKMSHKVLNHEEICHIANTKGGFASAF
jgi:hypothetical protein